MHEFCKESECVNFNGVKCEHASKNPILCRRTAKEFHLWLNEKTCSEPKDIERATPVQLRNSLELVEKLKQAGIRFVPIPVLNAAEYNYRIVELTKLIENIINNHRVE